MKKSTAFPIILVVILGVLTGFLAGNYIEDFSKSNITGDENSAKADIEINFEEESPLEDLSMRDVCCNDSLKVVEDPVNEGDKAARFRLRPTQNFSKVGNIYKTRNEVFPEGEIERKMNENNITTKDKESWYGFSVRPIHNLSFSNTFELVFQLHHVNDDCDTYGGPPPISIYAVEDSFVVQNVGDEDKCQKNWSKVTDEGEKSWNFDLNRGEWTDWVIHTNWRHDEEGLFEVWRNGEKVIERTGEPVTYNDEKLHLFQFGVYKSPWLNNTRNSNRTYYLDNFRASGPEGSYREVAPR